DELKHFHEPLYHEYLDTMPGNILAVNRMKELWNYMSIFFPNDEKKIKDIRKARTDKEFEASVRVLFSSGTFINI
ncbi:MAG: tRNA-dihydrouridine synthase family protein, partial [Butyrivibrio sp.]|nr:tRNA-dihydrouridine synthase family protein [Butyrivibrio sp.]